MVCLEGGLQLRHFLRTLINYLSKSLLLNTIQMRNLHATISSIFPKLLFQKKKYQNLLSFQRSYWGSILQYGCGQFISGDYLGILWFNLLEWSLILILLLNVHPKTKIILFLFLVQRENEFPLRYRDIGRNHKLNF